MRSCFIQRRIFVLIFTYCVTLCAAQTSIGGAILRIEWTYSNPDSQLDNGNSCDRHLNRQCDVYFELCLRNAASISTDKCHLLQRVTESYHNTDHLTFEGNKAIRLTIPRPVPNFYTFKITAYDEDIFPNDELIGNFVAENVDIKPNGQWKQLPMSNTGPQKKNQRLKIEVKMQMECMDSFYGNHCMVECHPDPTKFNCDTNGNKLCFPGLTGADCDKEDSCFYETCAPHATCQNRVDSKGRICICNDGEGPECYPDHDPCLTSPCQHGGECYSVGIYNESFRCNCTEQWTGHRCNERRLACLEAALEQQRTTGKNTSEICLNRGKCLEYTDKFAYRCHCEEGWTGEHCEIPASKNTNWLIFGGITFIGILLIALTIIITLVLVWRHRSLMRKFKGFEGSEGIIYYHNNRDSTATNCSTISVLHSPVNELYGTWPHKNQVPVLSPTSELLPKAHTNGVYDECDPFGIYSKSGQNNTDGRDNTLRKLSLPQNREQYGLDDPAPPLPERPQDLGLVTFRQPSLGHTPTVGLTSPYMGVYSPSITGNSFLGQNSNTVYHPLSPTIYRAPSTFTSTVSK